VKAVFALAGALLACTLVQAKEAAPLAEDPVVEQRLVALAQDMRCLVCQNESLAGSRADLAADLRRELREQIKQGKSDDEIKAFMVSRYGDFVLYKPPVKPTTWLLWGGPFVLMVAGVAGLLAYLSRRTRTSKSVPLDDAELARARALLDEGPA
jgi:cytochrome c-type biogenesis protein CcmH